MEAMGSSQFPPGFRFHPTDQELIIHYLRNKVISSNTMVTAIIADVDIYKSNPWDLPGKAFFGEEEWFFFSPRDRKYPNGARPNRAAGSGYWKATGIDKPILATGGSKCLGVKKALVFYKGRPPKGIKTDWVMHEYRLLDAGSSSLPQKPKGNMRLDDWVLCRVRHKGVAQSDEKEVETNIPCCNISRNVEPQQPLRDETTTSSSSSSSSVICNWSDSQLLDYLLGSQESHDEAAGADWHSDNSQLCTPKTSTSSAMPTPAPHQLSSMFDSIKRALSFGALDELMLQPPSKRLHYSIRYAGDQLASPAE